MADKAEKAEKAAQNDKDSESESEAEGEPVEDDEPKKKKKKKKAAGTGGVHVPDEWPWEEAKAVFMKPDVLHGNDVEVSCSILLLIVRQVCSYMRRSWSGRTPMWMVLFSF